MGVGIALGACGGGAVDREAAVVADIDVPSPTALAAGEGAWVRADRKLRFIDSATNELAPLLADEIIDDVAIGDSSVWVTTRSNELIRIDTATKAETARTTLPFAQYVVGYRIAVGEAGVWISSYDDDTVIRVDPVSLEVVAEIGVRDPEDLAVGQGAVWVNIAFGRLTRIDPATNEVTTVVRSLNARHVAVGFGSAWTYDDRTSRLTRLDATTGKVTSTVDINVAALAVGEGSVWVNSCMDVTRVDPKSDEIIGTVPDVPGCGAPSDLAVGDGAVWVGGYEDDAITRIDPAKV